MVDPSMLSIKADDRTQDAELVATYVPCLWLSLVNLTNRFFPSGQAWR